MTGLSNHDYQIWFPGATDWELWLLQNGKASLVKRRSVGEILDFDLSLKASRVLALPITHQVAFPFVSNAMDSIKLLQSAKMHVERQGQGFDAAGVMVDAVFGDPPNTITRIDAPLQKVNQDSGCNEIPDIVVPAATMIALERNAIAIWEELGKTVVAFERNGKTIYYDKLVGSGPEAGNEVFRLQFQLGSEGMIEKTEVISIWSKSHHNVFDNRFQVPIDREERPAPTWITPEISLKPSWLRGFALRKAEKTRKTRQSIIAILGIAIFMVILFSFFVTRYLQARDLKREIQKLTPVASRIESIQSRWDEVSTGVDPDASFLEVWRNVFILPSLTLVEISRLDITRNGIEISGKAEEASQALQFIEDITSCPSLTAYSWVHQPVGIEKDGSAKFELKGNK